MSKMLNKLQKSKKAYMLVGHYDVMGCYQEVVEEDALICLLPRDISKHIYLDKDLTIHVAPKFEVRVFARNKELVEEYFKIVNDRECFKGMLDCFSKYNERSAEYIYTTIDLEEERRLQSEALSY